MLQYFCSWNDQFIQNNCLVHLQYETVLCEHIMKDICKGSKAERTLMTENVEHETEDTFHVFSGWRPWAFNENKNSKTLV